MCFTFTRFFLYFIQFKQFISWSEKEQSYLCSLLDEINKESSYDEYSKSGDDLSESSYNLESEQNEKEITIDIIQVKIKWLNKTS